MIKKMNVLTPNNNWIITNREFLELTPTAEFGFVVQLLEEHDKMNVLIPISNIIL